MPDRASLTLGPALDPASGQPLDESVAIGSSDLTTHGVVVGMTGSGKTGLAVVLLEEALAAGIPALVVDPKGDMGNLALVFPDLAPASFRPWVNESDAQAAGLSVDAYAEQVATTWRDGLTASGITTERLEALRAAADVTVYTPGSSSGVPLNVIGSLRAPTLSWDTEAEALRDEIQGTVTSLLGLIGVEADPLASREHVLLSNLVENAWRAGRDLDLGTLIGEIQTPPLRKLGVFDLEQFFPQKERTELAFRFNALVASPTFAAWGEGVALDPQSLLFTPEGKPRCAVIYLAHLSDAERQFVVTLVFSKLVTWMRGQSGTSDLRALAYMDEVFGFVPPTAEPPAKKPILTILKQGRAFGVGLVLSTQNPVDLDYKAMANAGTWLVGRMQTENDKSRVLEGLRSAAGTTDIDALDKAIGGLGKRQFLLVSAKSSTPRLLTTRWAMSYLRGPLTREQLADLPSSKAASAALAATPSAAPAAATTVDPSATPVAPPVASGVQVGYVDPAAAWASEVGAVAGGTKMAAAIACRCSLRYDETKAGLDVTQEWEAIIPLDGGLDLDGLIEVDYDERDLSTEAPASATYELPEAPIGETSFFRDVANQLEQRLVAGRALEIQRNQTLKLWSRPDETPDAFARRCEAAADEQADAETAKLRDKLETKQERLHNALRTAELRKEQALEEASSRRQRELIQGAGSLIGALLGGRSKTRGLSKIGGALSGSAAKARAQAASAKQTDLEEDLLELEQELADDIAEIQERWEAVAAETDTVPVRLEASDVKVLETRLIWIPRS